MTPVRPGALEVPNIAQLNVRCRGFCFPSRMSLYGPKAEIVYVDFLTTQISSHGHLRAQSSEEVM
jgi:hypothetical protein